MNELIFEAYVWLNQVAGDISKPIYAFAIGLNVFGVTAFLLGVIGATAPCQLTSNSGAIALVTKHISRRLAWIQTGYFIMGKSLVYLSLGVLAAFFGMTIQDIPIINEIFFRQMIGPVLIIVGVALLGIIPIRFAVLNRWYLWIKKRMNFKNSALGLGVTMGFLFCPTLFWLFFGMLIPGSAEYPLGIMDPLFFSIGTALPLIIFTTCLSAGTLLATKVLTKVNVIHTVLKFLSAVLFIFSGIYETVSYWFI
ncbi:MAG TPA: sulfite exporter TauE/SafE family protein [Bacilli bacterium]